MRLDRLGPSSFEARPSSGLVPSGNIKPVGIPARPGEVAPPTRRDPVPTLPARLGPMETQKTERPLAITPTPQQSRTTAEPSTHTAAEKITEVATSPHPSVEPATVQLRNTDTGQVTPYAAAEARGPHAAGMEGKGAAAKPARLPAPAADVAGDTSPQAATGRQTQNDPPVSKPGANEVFPDTVVEHDRQAAIDPDGTSSNKVGDDVEKSLAVPDVQQTESSTTVDLPVGPGIVDEHDSVNMAWVDTFFGSEARQTVIADIEEAVTYFGNPPLLRDVAEEVSRRLQNPPDRLEANREEPGTNRLDDYTNNRYQPQEVFVYNQRQGEPIIRVGIIDDVDGSPKVESIIYSQFKISVDNPTIVHETTVTIHGLAKRTYAGQPFVGEYYVPDKDGNLPPAGVFVDFRQYEVRQDDGLVEKARVYGTVGSTVGKEGWKVSGYPGDREAFPFLANSIPQAPEGYFAMLADTSFLPSVDQTLRPEFFSEDLPKVSRRRIASSRNGEL